MTLNEALSQGMLVSGLGMTIVFAVLVILMLVLMIMKVVFYKEDKPSKQKKNPKISKNGDEELMAVIAAAVAAGTQPSMSEDELIAVLTAAVAASLNTSTYNLKIKSYRRIGSNAPVWNRAGVRETIENRF